MGHYDEQREEEAEQSRRDTLARQARCLHHWRIDRVDEYGEPIMLCCAKCNKVTRAKIRTTSTLPSTGSFK